MIWLTAIAMGLAGSLHCLGMCAPLQLALPYNNPGVWPLKFLAYQSGRILTYGILGAFIGTIGQTIVSVGFQQALSVFSGLLILVIVLYGKKLYTFNTKGIFGSLYNSLKIKMANLLSGKLNTVKLFSLGTLNGLLPCGMVYLAIAASFSTGSVQGAFMYMLLFGLGTWPALFVVHVLKHRMPPFAYTNQFIGTISVLVAFILILRGLNLGIPYLSPDFSVGFAKNTLTPINCH